MLSHLDERARAPYPLLRQSLDVAVPGRGYGLVQSSSPHQRELREAGRLQHPTGGGIRPIGQRRDLMSTTVSK